MKGSFLLNNHSVGYLIHGQLFSMEYSITNCLFVVIYSKGNGIKLRKALGKYNAISNVYRPAVYFYSFGLGIRKFKHDLKINFLNTKMETPNITFSLPNKDTKVILKTNPVTFNNKEIHTKIPSIKLKSGIFIQNKYSQLTYNKIKQAKNEL
jgi:hypothetical protein